MEYTELSADQQKEILVNRKRQYEAEHFNHVVNRDLLVAGGATDAETQRAIKTAEAALVVLDAAHAETVKKIKKIKPTTPTTTPTTPTTPTPNP